MWEAIQCFLLKDPWATIQTVILAVSVVILIWQIYELRKATAMEGFNTLAAALNSKESIDARNLLYKNKNNLHSLSSEEIASIKRLIVLLDQLGCLVNRKLIPEREAIEMYWDVVIKCWDSSVSVIQEERRQKRIKQRKFQKKTADKKIIQYAKSKGLFKSLRIYRLRAARKYRLATGFKRYPKLKPKAKDYPATHYENFEMLVYRCERYCKKRKLDRPITY